MKKITVRHAAANRKTGMTLAEIGTFLQAAKDDSVPGFLTPRIRTTWRNTIRSMEITLTDGES